MIKRIVNYLKWFFCTDIIHRENNIPNQKNKKYNAIQYKLEHDIVPLKTVYRGKIRKYNGSNMCIAFCKKCRNKTKHIINQDNVFSKDRICLICLENKGRGGALVLVRN